MKEFKKLPTFKDEAEEYSFWENHDISEYFDMSKVKSVRFSNLKKTIRKKLD